MASSKITALRPITLEVDTQDTVSDMADAMMRPVFAAAADLEARLELEGLPRNMRTKFRVSISQALRDALNADGAFEVIVDDGDGL